MNQVSSNAQPFRFLDLPGEIRNRVYEYALTSDSGQLGYRITLHLRFQDYNRLKETAVAETEKLIMRKRSIIPALMHGKVEFNRLKYVCKQLHKETAGIELKYNEVVFTIWADYMSEFSVYCRYLYLYASRPFWVHASLLDDFLKLCDYSPRSKWLTSVVLRPNPNNSRTYNDKKSKFVKLAARICVANPRLEIKYLIDSEIVPPHGTKTAVRWLVNMESLIIDVHKGLISKRKSVLPVPGLPHGRLMMTDLWEEAKHVARTTVPNLKILPVVIYDEATLNGIADDAFVTPSTYTTAESNHWLHLKTYFIRWYRFGL